MKENSLFFPPLLTKTSYPFQPLLFFFKYFLKGKSITAFPLCVCICVCMSAGTHVCADVAVFLLMLSFFFIFETISHWP